MMKKTLMALAALLVCATTMAASADMEESKEKKESVRKVPTFTRIDIRGWADVIYTQGNRTSVKVVGSASGISRVSTTVADGTLCISSKDDGVFSGNFNLFGFSSSGGAKVYVTSPDLTGVTITGSGNFDSKGKIDSDNFTLTIKGSGDVEMKYIICDNFKLDLRGSGDVELDYLRCATSTMAIKGSGDIEVKQDKVNFTNIDLYGSGDVKMALSQCGVVNCRLTGSGDITLSGSAKQVNKKVHGSGDISTSRLKVLHR